MHLHSLELSGFKSFANKTTLTFPKGITAIVGPNGSGKSNVTDAIRWVLGEQSMKTLRGKKSEDVIFSGSESKGRHGVCEVCLRLDNVDQGIPIEFEDIAIARKLYRSGDSEYLLNGAKSPLQEISYLLAQGHIGQKSFSVIGQGLIDQWLMATPKERKGFFEEAAGIKPFQMKRQQSLQKLQKAKEQMSQAKLVFHELSPRLSTLSRQVKKLQEREELQAALQELQYAYFGTLWIDLEERLSSLAQKSAPLEQSYNTQQTVLAELQEKWALLEKQQPKQPQNTSLQEAYEKALQEKMTLSQQLMQVQYEIKQAQMQLPTKQASVSFSDLLSFVKDLISKATAFKKTLSSQEDVTLIKKEADAFLSPISVFSKKLEQPAPKKLEVPKALLEKHDTLSAQVKQQEAHIASLKQEMHQAQEQVTKERQELISLQQQLQEAQRQMQTISRERESMHIDATRLETKKEELMSAITQDMGEVPQFKKDTINTDQTVDQLRTSYYAKKQKLEQIGAIDPEAVKEYEQIKERHAFLENQIDDLTSSIASLETVIVKLDTQMHEQFQKSFVQINKAFDTYFKQLFSGGTASLDLISSEEESLDGIEISARPPGKRISHLSMLSGGEKALTSIALICAILKTQSSPFVVLDEVDAALDESNSVKFAHILKELAQDTQFIVITHNRSTMQQAEVLYGVTMGSDGISKLMSLSFEEAKKSIVANRA